MSNSKLCLSSQLCIIMHEDHSSVALLHIDIGVEVALALLEEKHEETSLLNRGKKYYNG